MYTEEQEVDVETAECNMKQGNYKSIFPGPTPTPHPAINILRLPALFHPLPFILILFPLLHIIQTVRFQIHWLIQFLKLCIASRLNSSEGRGGTAWESSET
jgi:hypothetical protein